MPDLVKSYFFGVQGSRREEPGRAWKGWKDDATDDPVYEGHAHPGATVAGLDGFAVAGELGPAVRLLGNAGGQGGARRNGGQPDPHDVYFRPPGLCETSWAGTFAVAFHRPLALVQVEPDRGRESVFLLAAQRGPPRRDFPRHRFGGRGPVLAGGEASGGAGRLEGWEKSQTEGLFLGCHAEPVEA